MNAARPNILKIVRPDPEARIMTALPDSVVEQLAELWCEALLTNLRKHPVQPSLKRAS
jgi:hypothetical protein